MVIKKKPKFKIAHVTAPGSTFYGVSPRNPNDARVLLMCTDLEAAQDKLSTILHKDMWRIGKYKELPLT